jgi:hypothetical protein
MLSCNSIRASICGLALSWKYSPQALGASQLIVFKLKKLTKIPERKELCNGKLVNA